MAETEAKVGEVLGSLRDQSLPDGDRVHRSPRKGLCLREQGLSHLGQQFFSGMYKGKAAKHSLSSFPLSLHHSRGTRARGCSQ